MKVQLEKSLNNLSVIENEMTKAIVDVAVVYFIDRVDLGQP